MKIKHRGKKWKAETNSDKKRRKYNGRKEMRKSETKRTKRRNGSKGIRKEWEEQNPTERKEEMEVKEYEINVKKRNQATGKRSNEREWSDWKGKKTEKEK